MPCARTTSQDSSVVPALARAGIVAVLAVLLAGPALPAPAQAAVAGGQASAQRGSASAMPADPPRPTRAQAGSADRTPSGSPPEPTRLDGAVAARRYGLPTVLAVVLVLGVASLHLRLLLAEPAARPAEPSGAAAPDRQRRHGIGAPRW